MPVNQLSRRHNNLVICVQGEENPSDKEWDEFLAVLRSGEGAAKASVLVYTDCSGPNSQQRDRLKATLGNAQTRAAIIAEKVTTRFIVSSIAFITPRIKTFRKTEIEEAFEFLGLDETTKGMARRTLREFIALVSGKSS